jgi:hypothetical protein
MSSIFQEQYAPFPWLIYGCRWFWVRLHGWWSLSLGLVLNIIAGLFLYPISPFAEFTQVWVYQYKLVIAFGLLVFLCLTLFVGFISRFETTPSLSRRQRHYLQQMVLEHQSLKASGIPEIFFPPSIKLEDVFLSPEFFCERTPAGIDYPLRPEEIPLWQRLFAQRHRKFPRAFTRRAEEDEKGGIELFWSRFSRDYPVAVVQGYPGMGKSTLTKRITLHMARRCLGTPDARMPPLSPALVPLLIELKAYADAFKAAQKRGETLQISCYIPHLLKQRTWQGKDPWPFLRHCLEEGRCLVLFDGLDETGDAEVRLQIAQAMRSFILDQRNTPPRQKTFNRFLITSRVAGYSPQAFDDTPLRDYRLAELREPLMHEFLTNWYNAVITVEAAARDAEIRMQQLHQAIKEHGPLFQLAENPLLLMLMAGMQKHGIHLPTERAELYDTITLTLLKYREQNKRLPFIDEDEAVRRLGPLAYAMQTTDFIADEQTVLQSLRATIEAERKRTNAAEPANAQAQEQIEIEKQVRKFLVLIRERSNLFVQRTGEDFSFFHKSFQEYFVARYLLARIQQQRAREIQHLLTLVRQNSDIWREPFLFALGYQSLGRGRDPSIACDLLQGILDANKQETDPGRYVHILLLAAQGVIEAKAQTFEPAVEEQIIEELLSCYHQAQQEERFTDCAQIEQMLTSWLLLLSEEDPAPSWFRTICTIVQDCQQPGLQRATLTLLILILDKEMYPQFFYDMLIPLLLALTGLPTPDLENQPVASLQNVEYSVADLALVTLSCMGKHGPAGLLVNVVRQRFRQEPEHLSLLARYSLESQTLLTCCIPPLSDDQRQNYEEAVERWSTLLKRRQKHPRRAIHEDMAECLKIHQALLDCAEEVLYPTSLHLLAMLKASRATPQQNWKKVWQDYLLKTLHAVTASSAISYQEIILLWSSLFPATREWIPLQEQIFADYTRHASSSRRFAQRFLATLGIDLRDWRDWRDLLDLRDWRYLRGLRDWRYLRGLRDWRYLRGLRDWLDLRDWRYLLLLATSGEHAIQLLSSAQEPEKIDLFALLLARLLYIQKKDEVQQASAEGKEKKGEAQHIVTVAWKELTTTRKTQRELSMVLLDILRYQPVRSSEEIVFVQQLAAQATDQEIQQAVLEALRHAQPEQDAVPQLQSASASRDTQIAGAAQQALENWQKKDQRKI